MAPTLAFINPALSTRNVGDLFIEDSVKRILVYDRDGSVDVDPRRPISAYDIDRINATEAAVIVGTNLWYRNMMRPGRWQFRLENLRKIRAPIIPLGVGTTRHDHDNGFDADTLAQIRHIHASCPLGSARDPRTAEALREAGVKNVSMTGCPTLYRSLQPDWRLNVKSASRRIVLTVRKGQRHNLRLLAGSLRQMGYDPVVAAQQPKDRFLRRWIPFLQRPVETIHQYQLAPYLGLVKHARGAIGWRLHGNIFHLAHGNPAIFFANCSRAQSFCEAFDLPCLFCPDGRRLSASQIAEMIEKLFDPASFEAFGQRYRAHRQTMIQFLEANGLPHRLRRDAGMDVAAPAA